MSLSRSLAYNQLAELLLKPALQGIANAVLLADDLITPAGDDFIQRIYRSFGAASGPAGATPPPIRYVERVDTGLPRYQLGQMCDVLLGVVTGDLAPPTNRNKLALIQYAKDALDVPGFGPDYWGQPPHIQPGAPVPKLHVWHWQAK